MSALTRIRGLPPSLVGGCALLLLVWGGALLASWIVTHDPLTQELGMRLQRPSFAHLCGTDGLGRDVFSRLVFGARATFGLVALVAALMVPLGLVVGIVAGYW